MTGSKSAGTVYERREFKICCSVQLIAAARAQMHGDANGWTFCVFILGNLILTFATARSKRNIPKYPRWLALHPELTDVVQVQEISAEGKSRTIFFAESNQSVPLISRIFERGAWEKRVLARGDETMTDIVNSRSYRRTLKRLKEEQRKDAAAKERRKDGKAKHKKRSSA